MASYSQMEERFLQKVSKEKKSGCWVWKGSKRWSERKTGPSGLMFNPFIQRLEDAHRISWKLFRSPKKIDNKFVRQSCNNRLCVNPDHLFLDADYKTGADHPSAKLSEEDVKEIRSIKLRNEKRKTLDECAEYFGVSRETIRKIVLKRTSGEGKLTESQVKQVKEMYRPVENYKKFIDAGVSKGAISSILAGRTWKDLK